MIRTEITNIGDPFILLHEDKYYMYATSAPDGFKVFTSLDLINWEEAGYCYKDSTWAINCFWAPEVYYYNNKFYMLYTGRWKKNESLRTALAVSDSPLGPFKDINDGPLFDLGFATIDATLFFDDDGKIYLYFVRDCSEYIVGGVHTSAIYAVEIDKELKHFIGKPVLISIPDCEWETSLDKEWCWNEGPAVLKKNGTYYLNYSVNCFNNLNYCIACSESKNPLGPYKKYDNNPILKYRENDFSGPGHNNFFTTKEGVLMTSFHIHTYYDKPSGNRRACIGLVEFDNTDKMVIKVDF